VHINRNPSVGKVWFDRHQQGEADMFGHRLDLYPCLSMELIDTAENGLPRSLKMPRAPQPSLDPSPHAVGHSS
jgi:hypothetical protein